MVDRKRIAIALSGASGAPYFLRLVERLRGRPDLEIHLVASDGGKRVLLEECGLKWTDLDRDGIIFHQEKDLGDSLASGSNLLDALVVVPCSMHTVGALAGGLTLNLIHRCGAVQLKEGRSLILVFRESPLSLIGLRALTTLKEAGAVIMPASPGFYHQPETITHLLDTVVDRVMDHLRVEDAGIKRWRP